MFRMKKGPDTSAEPSAGSPSADFDRPSEEAKTSGNGGEEGRLAAVPRRPIGLPTRPLTGSSASLDLPRRSLENGATGSRGDTAGGGIRERTLAVGKDVRLNGEIGACDRLIVDGLVEVKACDCRHIQINPGGCFRGEADVTEAEIFGRFDGDLTARTRLIVRSSGMVTGRIRYGHIIIEAGGVVSGEIAALDEPGESRAPGEEWPVSPAVVGSPVAVAE